MVRVFQPSVFDTLGSRVFQGAMTVLQTSIDSESIKQVCDVSLTLSQFTDNSKTVEQVYYSGIAAQVGDTTLTSKIVGETGKTIKRQGSNST